MPDPIRWSPHFPFSADIGSAILRPLPAMKTRNAIARALRIVWPEADEQLPDFDQTPPARVPHSS